MKLRKFTAGLLALAMVLTLVALPVAAADYSALAVPKIAKNTDNQVLGAIKVTAKDFYAESSAVVKIPNFNITKITVKNSTLNTPADMVVTVKDSVTTDVYGNAGAGDPTGAVDAALGANEFKLEVPAGAALSGTNTDLTFSLIVEGKSTADGDVVANITGLQGQFTSASVVVATTGSANLTVALDGTAGSMSSNSREFTLLVTENVPGALNDAGNVDLTLPTGFKWDISSVGVSALVGNASKMATPVPADVTNSGKKLTIKSDGSASTVASIYRLKVKVTAERDAKFGDVVVSTGDNSKVTQADIVVAKYQDFGITVAVEEKDVFAGAAVKAGKLTISESAAGSFVEGRVIYLTLPAGMKWDGSQTFATGNAYVAPASHGVDSTDGRTYKIVLGTKTTAAKKIEIKEPKVMAKLAYTGDINVEISGNAGVEGTYKLGTVAAPVTVTAEQTDMVVGVQSQAAGKIVVKEAKAGVLGYDGKITIEFDGASTASFEGKPEVKVTEGNLAIKVDSYDSNKIVLKVTSDSSKVSTFEITGLKYTLNRSVPEGDFTIKLIDSYDDKLIADSTVRVGFDKDEDKVIAKVSNATVVTPADNKAVVGEVKFVIDSKTYTANGKEVAMDVAPYIQDGRTMLPVRFVAAALGVSDDNIIWDATAKTVTIMKGDRIAQMTIGSKAMLVNGVTVQMDTAAAIKDGRTVLPLRFAAQALGANIEWDDATRTVTIN